MKKQFMLATVILATGILSSCSEQAVSPNQPDEQINTAAARRANRSFNAHLSGGEEVPAVMTNATGQANFKLNKEGTELSFKLIVANIENVRMAHIHRGSKGTNGPVVAFLLPMQVPSPIIPSPQGVLVEGVIKASDLRGSLAGKPLTDLLAEMEAGNTYVNVHTTQNMSGEIRGQIR